MDDGDQPYPSWVMAKGLGGADKWMMATIIHLSPGFIQPADHRMHTRLGGPHVRLG